MDLQVLSANGDVVRTIQVSDSVFAREVSDGSIYHAIRNELANMRIGTACTKTRSEVNGSHKKPWRQKGTGRARSGTKQSPVWVGGGVAFGPRPRSYNYYMPRKMKRTALLSLISQRVATGSLFVMDDGAIAGEKTKQFVASVSKVAECRKAVFILRDADTSVKRAARNVSWVSTLSYDRLRAHDLFYAERVILTESSARALSDFYDK